VFRLSLLIRLLSTQADLKDCIESSAMEKPVKYEMPLEEYGFSEKELGVCVKVLGCLSSERGKLLFEERRMKCLRKAVVPFTQAMENKFPSNLDKVARRKEAKQLRNARRQRQKLQDSHYIDSSKLRAKRLEELKALQSMGEDATRLLIPDGATGESFEGPQAEYVLQDISEDELGGQTLSEDRSSLKRKADDICVSSTGDKRTDPRVLSRPRSCYTCKIRFYKLHHFYDQLCPACAALGYAKRMQTTDLTGRVALVSGGRVKIGYQTALKLLKAGCTVIVTTRFPQDAANRYANEADFTEWEDNLTIYGLDFRYVPGVEKFCAFLSSTLPRLDIIINNACQTIRRPPAYYKHLLPGEERPVNAAPKSIQNILGKQLYQDRVHFSGSVTLKVDDSPNHLPSKLLNTREGKTSSKSGRPKSNVASTVEHKSIIAGTTDENTSSTSSVGFANLSASEMSQVQLVCGDDNTKDFPCAAFDINQQQIDLRTHNSWLVKLEDVETPELLEVISINMMAPFILNSRLKHLMCRASCAEVNKFIINVSAMEGKFYRFKTANHPHTNMAKAALNMMTRTSAEDYAKSNIFMNSVDTGWINDENPIGRAREIFEKNNFQTPIDEIDAAARILDPIMVGANAKLGHCPRGKFYKDFKETEW
jgi:NAD(P)-dependent dehydrogenase (short-subunit alcohol dehydrogenase family)